MTTMTFVLLALGSVLLIVPSIRITLFHLLAAALFLIGGIIRRLFGAAPAWINAAGNWLRNATLATVGWFVTVVTILGWLLVGFVLANIAAITFGGYGGGWFLWAEAVALGTVCFTLFMVSRLWNGKAFAVATLVFYGLAALGAAFPSVVRVYPQLFVIGMFLIPLIKVLWVLSSHSSVPAGIQGMLKGLIGLVGTLAMIVLVGVIGANYVGWIHLHGNRLIFQNQVINDQAHAEANFHEKAEAAINNTVVGIYTTLGNEIAMGAPAATKADPDITKLQAQKDIVARAYSINPTVTDPISVTPTTRTNPNVVWALIWMLVILAVGTIAMVSIAFSSSESATPATPSTGHGGHP